MISKYFPKNSLSNILYHFPTFSLINNLLISWCNSFTKQCANNIYMTSVHLIDKYNHRLHLMLRCASVFHPCLLVKSRLKTKYNTKKLHLRRRCCFLEVWWNIETVVSNCSNQMPYWNTIWRQLEREQARIRKLLKQITKIAVNTSTNSNLLVPL